MDLVQIGQTTDNRQTGKSLNGFAITRCIDNADNFDIRTFTAAQRKNFSEIATPGKGDTRPSALLTDSEKCRTLFTG